MTHFTAPSCKPALQPITLPSNLPSQVLLSDEWRMSRASICLQVMSSQALADVVLNFVLHQSNSQHRSVGCRVASNGQFHHSTKKGRHKVLYVTIIEGVYVYLSSNLTQACIRTGK